MSALGETRLALPFAPWLQLFTLVVWLGGFGALLYGILGNDAFFVPIVTWMLAGGAVFVAVLRGTRLHLFEDGLRAGGRFVAYRDVARLEREPAWNRALLVLAGGEKLVVGPLVQMRSPPSASGFAAALDELDRRIERARSAPSSQLVRDLERREEPSLAWLARARAAISSGGFRDEAVGRADVLGVVLDPTADPTARVAAAVVLRSGLTDEERERIRVAAAGTATPKVRVALETAADEAASDAQVGDRVARVAPRASR